MTTPTVSVVMPVYNAERYVAQTMDSILGQTFGDFEFIVIDDGSKDGSLAVLQEYARRDPRIRLISRPNTGYVRALNEGLGLVRGKYLARIDADDLAHPDRFRLQVARMDAEPELVALGSCALAIDEDGRPLGAYDNPLTHEEIERNHLAGHSSIHHPAVMMRPEAVNRVGGYRTQFMPCEDFDLWVRLGEVGRLANLPERLLTKRLMVGSAVGSSLQKQDAQVKELLEDAWKRRGLPGEPKVPTRELFEAVDLYRQWSWMALKAGHVSTARRYAWKVVGAAPFRAESWRLMACSIRGR
jgi:glycosyltransferase involved in cell wall biosynthesis